MESVYIAIFSTFAITCAVCYKVFAVRMAKKLLEQERQLRAESQARFADLINRLNHSGTAKYGSSLVGLMGVISWGLRNCTTQFVKLRDAREWNTTLPTTELSEIESNEFQLAISIAKKFLEGDRETLREFNPDQGVNEEK